MKSTENVKLEINAPCLYIKEYQLNYIYEKIPPKDHYMVSITRNRNGDFMFFEGWRNERGEVEQCKTYLIFMLKGINMWGIE